MKFSSVFHDKNGTSVLVLPKKKMVVLCLSFSLYFLSHVKSRGEEKKRRGTRTRHGRTLPSSYLLHSHSNCSPASVKSQRRITSYSSLATIPSRIRSRSVSDPFTPSRHIELALPRRRPHPVSPLRCRWLLLGIPGPKEWLKEQKKKSSKFLLAPIEDSRTSLEIAYRMITEEMGPETSGSGEIRRLLNSAARDCVAEDRNSIVAFQAQSGVEVCTFRLLVKNAASLLDNNDPVKLETEALLDKLIRSFSSVGDLVDNNDLGITSDRQKVEVGLKDTMSALDNFEEGIKHCIGI